MRLLGWGRGDICMRVCSPNRVSAAVPTLGPPSPHVPMHGDGGEMVGRWRGDWVRARVGVLAAHAELAADAEGGHRHWDAALIGLGARGKG